ncbi:RusA family crossover junction endodeoxyribonuclease [Citrobacter meridianamericanus]|uniref:RusA family crossover junction endodeoxyribonuclease n=1 Tax=Citrobacter meridianamericanus TaxID=2894201 RepID=UPI0039BE2469
MSEYKITPVGKFRMTCAEKWKKRLEDLRYRAFCGEVRLRGVELPESGSHISFILPMPASWSKKKQAEFNGKPHQVKPDFDNMMKALIDAIYENDAHIWDARASKAWG